MKDTRSFTRLGKWEEAEVALFQEGIVGVQGKGPAHSKYGKHLCVNPQCVRGGTGAVERAKMNLDGRKDQIMRNLGNHAKKSKLQ